MRGSFFFIATSMLFFSVYYTSVSSRAISSIWRVRRMFFSSRPSRYKESDSGSLFRKISPLGDPNLSMVPVLDAWVGEGNRVSKSELQRVINELRYYKRFKHALQISIWMTDKRRFSMSPLDVSMRLKLIFNVFGVERVEKYFDKIPENMRTFSAYLALLNCYTMAKSVDKAESIMQKARDFGFATKPIWYNLLMKLQFELGNMRELGDLLMEMEAKGISGDSFTYSVCMRACAAISDCKAMDRIVDIIESDPLVILDWSTYVVAAQCYIRMGLNDRALILLKKLEGRLATCTEKVFLVTILFNLYSNIRNKDELYRIWNHFKQENNIGNKIYMGMMRSLMKFGDIEGAERIFGDWESSGLYVDFRIHNILIEAYCTDGHIEKAEALIDRGISKGGNPWVMTWCLLAGGYLKANEVPKAVEALKKAISECPDKLTSRKDSMITCLEFLDSREYLKKEEDFMKFLRIEGIPLTETFNRLCDLIKDGKM